ncbi:ABC transporter permease [Rhizobium oryzicola]|uniref:ABC transporter permease n=1 Tax=Rhizobium oryzicola TaxID=1232668 RepID=A0ABT8SW44_9HYPH|nr:ABC transporter permease [Rhizobium oryzicola]MDO1582639.1 ABC transporter permease [Rhizobium oryzicola]
MLMFLAKRLATGVILLASIATITFFLVFSGTQRVVVNILGQSATDADIAALTRKLGIDRPLLTQYADWLSHALRGDLGNAWTMDGSVTDILGRTLPVTLSIVAFAIAVMAILAALLGIAAATRSGWIDRLIQVLSVIGFSMPNFWLGLLLIIFFALTLQVLPATGFVSPASSVTGWLASITLPAGALILSGVASAAQQVRGAVLDALRQDYVRTLWARGVSPRSIFFRHALRNAVPAALTVLSVQFIALLSGSAVIERIFAIPGLGALTVQSAVVGDIPVLMGIVTSMVAVVVVVNLFIDLLNALANPKVRLS